ncbi:MAG: phenylalanine--tRNA ligase subunit alpha [Dehalococcoidales bacterium]|nr:phenylalanine--tRNA ligase subunit alpha [Dehalococcoidales bacterium]
MMQQLDELKKQALQELGKIQDVKELELWRVRYLGKKSSLTSILRNLAALPLEERKSAGARANQVKTDLESELQEKKQALREARLVSGAQKEILDISLPGRPLPNGRLHPITQTLNEILNIFVSMGFQIAGGPDVEWDYYNFEALNIPDEHPSRDTLSTCWVEPKTESGDHNMLLRTHTTAVTARVIEKMTPPIRVIEPGRVYRYEATDATHLPMFYQIDGLAVDKGITMADLKGTLYEFARRFFGEERKVRFRCDFFPFVEPGVEMAIECLTCNGKGCRLCGYSGWIEILGAGMTHPAVLRRGGIDPEEYSSFAFGIGIERLPMLRYGIDDIRLFYGNDLRFLRQF